MFTIGNIDKSVAGGFAVRIPGSSGPLRDHSLQTPGKDHHRHPQDCFIRFNPQQARMGLIFVTIYLSFAVTIWSLYRLSPFSQCGSLTVSRFSLRDFVPPTLALTSEPSEYLIMIAIQIVILRTLV